LHRAADSRPACRAPLAAFGLGRRGCESLILGLCSQVSDMGRTMAAGARGVPVESAGKPIQRLIRKLAGRLAPGQKGAGPLALGRLGPDPGLPPGLARLAVLLGLRREAE
jgi:hypothetical protein